MVKWIALLATSACGPPGLDTAKCPYTLNATQVLGKTATCGYLHVPENRAKAERMIKVPAIVFRAANPTGPPLVNLAGGPSQSWADLGLDQLTTEQTTRLAQDFVFIEQRGTGLSDPGLFCDTLSTCRS